MNLEIEFLFWFLYHVIEHIYFMLIYFCNVYFHILWMIKQICQNSISSQFLYFQTQKLYGIIFIKANDLHKGHSQQSKAERIVKNNSRVEILEYFMLDYQTFIPCLKIFEILLIIKKSRQWIIIGTKLS